MDQYIAILGTTPKSLPGAEAQDAGLLRQRACHPTSDCLSVLRRIPAAVSARVTRSRGRMLDRGERYQANPRTQATIAVAPAASEARRDVGRFELAEWRDIAGLRTACVTEIAPCEGEGVRAPPAALLYNVCAEKAKHLSEAEASRCLGRILNVTFSKWKSVRIQLYTLGFTVT